MKLMLLFTMQTLAAQYLVNNNCYENVKGTVGGYLCVQ